MCEVLVQADGSESLRVILIDLDLAIMLNEDGLPIEEESGPRFGTPPFVAIELLDNRDCPHYLRHDFESAFYVALWFTVNSKAGFLEREDFNTSHMKKSLWFLWTDGPLRTCLVKGDFRLAENFAPYQDWLVAVWRVLFNGRMDRWSRWADDDEGRELECELAETLGGCVTYSKFKAAMDDVRPKLKLMIPNLI